MGVPETSEAGGWPSDGPDGAPPRRHPHRRVPWFRWLLAVGVAGVVGWAMLSPGGIGARLSGVGSSISGTVSQVTENRQLEQATKMFNQWYGEQGRYPDYTQSQLDQQSDSGWGVGMDMSWCTPRDVVLTSLTASGTMSRLLLDGKVVGDVRGRVACPVDLVDPVPWQR